MSRGKVMSAFGALWLLACTTPGVKAPRTSSMAFAENFDDAMAPASWWLREVPGAAIVSGGELKLRSLPGNIFGSLTTGSNFLLRSAPALREGTTVQVTVTAAPELQYEQAGLIWYGDDANYVKVVVERLNGESHINLVREEDDRASVLIKASGDLSVPARIEFDDDGHLNFRNALGELVTLPVAPPGALDLRLRYHADRLVAEYRDHGSEIWQLAGSCAPPKVQTAAVGVFTAQGPDQGGKWVSFSRFQITSH